MYKACWLLKWLLSNKCYLLFLNGRNCHNWKDLKVQSKIYKKAHKESPEASISATEYTEQDHIHHQHSFPTSQL